MSHKTSNHDIRRPKNAPQFRWRVGSTAVEAPVKFQSDMSGFETDF